jgi:hypothetical protein
MHKNYTWKVWKEETTSEDLGIDGKIILKLILGKYGGRWGLDSSSSGEGLLGDLYEHRLQVL